MWSAFILLNYKHHPHSDSEASPGKAPAVQLTTMIFVWYFFFEVENSLVKGKNNKGFLAVHNLLVWVQPRFSILEPGSRILTAECLALIPARRHVLAVGNKAMGSADLLASKRSLGKRPRA